MKLKEKAKRFYAKQKQKKPYTKWKEVKNLEIIGKRFFDCGVYGLGNFTIVKAYKCKEYNENVKNFDGSNWFDKKCVLIRTDSGLMYVVPFCPWIDKIYDESGEKKLGDYYNEQSIW